MWFSVYWVIIFYKHITALRLFSILPPFNPDRGRLFIAIFSQITEYLRRRDMLIDLLKTVLQQVLYLRFAALDINIEFF